MTQYTKPTVLPAWGESAGGADVLQPTNAEIQAGWPLSNVPPSRKRFNWVLQYLAQGVRYLLQRGIPEWDAAEDYRINDCVMGSDGKTYKCIQAGINKNPTTQPTYWTRWGFTLAEIDAGGTTPAQFDNSVKRASTAFVKRQGMAFAFQTNISATTTLTAAGHVGAMILGNASTAITLTLPVAGTVADGGCIGFQNAGTVATTIRRQGTDTIYVGAGGNNTITVQPGEFVLFETDGFNWSASGTGVLGFAGSFGSSLAASGYQKLPSGLIIQWGGLSSAASTTTYASFPITFPGGAPFQVLASGYNASGGAQAYVTVNDATASGCAFNAFYANASVAPSQAGAGQVSIKYIAIGK